MRPRSASSLAAASLLLLGLLLAGCAARPAGGAVDPDSDASSPVPPGSEHPGIGDSDGGDAENGRSVHVLFTPDWQGAGPGHSIRLQRKDANCVRDEIDGTIEVKYGVNVVLMRTFADSAACGIERSWATWTVTYFEPDGTHRSAVLELAQTSNVGAYPMEFELRCYGGDLACDTSRAFAPEHNDASITTRFYPAT